MEDKPTFLKKKKEEDPVLLQAREEAAKQQPVFDKKSKLVFVNRMKYERAKVIFNLITGKQAPRTQEEAERKEHYIKQLASHDIALDSEEVLPAIYELLGGLIRTEKQQKDFEKEVEQEKKRAKKDRMGMRAN